MQKIEISNKIAKKLAILKPETSGMLWGTHSLNKVNIFKNLSKEENKFMVSKIELMKWFFMKPIDLNLCFFHVHSNSGKPSKFDFDNMIKDFLYCIVYKDYLFFYIKTNDEIKLLEYNIYD